MGRVPAYHEVLQEFIRRVTALHQINLEQNQRLNALENQLDNPDSLAEAEAKLAELDERLHQGKIHYGALIRVAKRVTVAQANYEPIYNAVKPKVDAATAFLNGIMPTVDSEFTREAQLTIESNTNRDELYTIKESLNNLLRDQLIRIRKSEDDAQYFSTVSQRQRSMELAMDMAEALHFYVYRNKIDVNHPPLAEAVWYDPTLPAPEGYNALALISGTNEGDSYPEHLENQPPSYWALALVQEP